MSQAHGCISVVRLGDKKCKIIGGGWGRVKNLKPGLINNGAFYIAVAVYIVMGSMTLVKYLTSISETSEIFPSAQISTSIFSI